MPSLRALLITAVSVLLAAGTYVIYLMNDAGEFRPVHNLHPGVCHKLDGLPGTEDITIHPAGAWAYLSSDDRRALTEGRPVPGAIYRYRLDNNGPVLQNLTPDADLSFRPHGISLFVDEQGRETLFVVNHPGESLFGAPDGHVGPAHTVEIYDVLADRLVLRRLIADPMLISPNDVHAIDHERFYVTNDHGTRPGLLRSLEDYLRLPWANVLYFDGSQLREVASGLSYANGINASPDGSRIYVAEVSRGRVQEYTRDIGSGDLSHHRTLNIGFGVDNIEVDPQTGDLWIGGHVRLLTFVRHATDASVAAPSQVVRVRVNDNNYEVETIFMDDGTLISGSSVGAWHGQRLLTGAVFDGHIVDCNLSPAPVTITRLLDAPIITPALDERMGTNIQGPSLIRVPDWVHNPLGKYYLYFADHKGEYIRLAYADALTGPWTVHTPGTLTLEQSHFPTTCPPCSVPDNSPVPAYAHIASPDVIVRHDTQEILMYIHGREAEVQVTRLAVSKDGLNFEGRPEILGRPYFRVFHWQDHYYGLAMPGFVYRSRGGYGQFEEGPRFFNDNMRHSALLLRGNQLHVFWTQVGDAPERILMSTLTLDGDWHDWTESPAVEVLRPEREWEGAGLPLIPSVRGDITVPANQLRDPAVFEEDGEIYLLYSVAGESGIAIAKLTFNP